MPTTLQGDTSDILVADDVDELIDGYHHALGDCSKEERGPSERLLSDGEDAALADLYGLRVRGWRRSKEALDHAASFREQGKTIVIEVISKYVRPGLAHLLEIERAMVRVGGRKAITPCPQRATMIFRPQDGVSKVAHRHADHTTTPQAAESIAK